MKTIKITRFISLLFLAPFFFLACNSEDHKKEVNDAPEIRVNVEKVKTDTNNNFLNASGKIAASKSANLSTRMTGYVEKIYVEVGDVVNQGQLLISINNTDLIAKAAQADAAIAQATAAFNNAEKDYTRFQNLFQQNSATQKELDDMTSRFEMAKAGLEAAKQMKNEINAQFSYANIRAPFDGVITDQLIDEGTMANPGMTLLGMEAPGKYEVTALVPESEISEIQPNTSVDVMVKSIGVVIKGKVAEISTSAKNTGGQYLVKIDLDKTQANILSGMFATVQFPVEKKSESTTVLVPKEAIVTKGQLSGIYTVSQSNTAMLRWLRLGRSWGDQVEVLSGLNTDEAYIVSADGKLYNGVKVSIQ